MGPSKLWSTRAEADPIFSEGLVVVTKLRYFRTLRQLVRWCKERGYSVGACKDAWSGPGYYYARSKKHISKHVKHLDVRRGGAVGRGPWRHTHDIAKVVRKLRKRVRREARAKVRKASKGLARKLPKKEAREVAAKEVIVAAVSRSRRGLSPSVKAIASYIWDSIPRRYKEGRGRVWTYVSVIALAKAIHRYCAERGIDWKSVDWAQVIDWKQGYRYAVAEVKRILGTGKYSDVTAKDISRIEKAWNELRRNLGLPETISPWELKALFY